jgi:CBS domain-containing protein
VKLAQDVMEPATLVSPRASLRELAQQLVAADVEGVCVCDDAGILVGVVTGMDLVFQQKKIEAPTAFVIFDLVLQFGRLSHREIEKMEAVTVGDLMTREVITAMRTTPLDEIATKMVSKHISLVPVLEAGRPIGVITRRGMIGASLRMLLSDHSAPSGVTG